MVDTEKESIQLKFAIYGTGHQISESSGKYISTVQWGELVWHIFELI